MSAQTEESPLQTRPLTDTTGIRYRKPLRLWPGIVAGALIVLCRFVIPIVAPNAFFREMPLALLGVFGGFLATIAVLLWWLFFSRAPWVERLAAPLLTIGVLLVTYRLVHASIAGGAMGFLLPVLALPVAALALVIWAVASQRLATLPRRALMPLAFVLAFGIFTLIRTGGFTGDFDNDFHWRWSKSPEELLLAKGEETPVASNQPVSAAPNGAEWPGFRGANRDGVVHGVRIETDWSKSPPVEMWRRPVGPGWSSFAVAGDLIYTQEQRGDEEDVACHNLTTGKPVWKHHDKARFWESNAGAGPRGTPTLSNGRVYTLGATGIVNALDGNSGNVIWSRNAATDTKTKTPGWGFSGSPLVIDDVVIVAVAGNLIAYNTGNGEPRWSKLDGGGGYSSPHEVKINGVTQILLLNAAGAISVAPADGKQLWEFPLPKTARIIQPAVAGDGDLVVHDGEGSVMRRIAVSQGPSGWTVQERWNADGLNPYYNDFVVMDGYAYGFAGSGLGCVDLKDDERKWTGGNYGHGQLVLLRDQSVLLVLAEAGDIAIVKAVPDQFTELARVPAIKGKTWNHPVLVKDVLLVRNSEEMAAFRLTLARN